MPLTCNTLELPSFAMQAALPINSSLNCSGLAGSLRSGFEASLYVRPGDYRVGLCRGGNQGPKQIQNAGRNLRRCDLLFQRPDPRARQASPTYSLLDTAAVAAMAVAVVTAATEAPEAAVTEQHVLFTAMSEV